MAFQGHFLSFLWYAGTLKISYNILLTTKAVLGIWDVWRGWADVVLSRWWFIRLCGLSDIKRMLRWSGKCRRKDVLWNVWFSCRDVWGDLLQGICSFLSRLGRIIKNAAHILALLQFYGFIFTFIWGWMHADLPWNLWICWCEVPLLNEFEGNIKLSKITVILILCALRFKFL